MIGSEVGMHEYALRWRSCEKVGDLLDEMVWETKAA